MAQTRSEGWAEDGQIGDRLGQILRWWLGELRDLVPYSLKKRAVAAPAAFGCSLFPGGRVAFARLSDARAALPGEAEAMPLERLGAHVAALLGAARRRNVRLSVPAELCLVRRTRIPGRALPHAGAILRGEIESLMPLDPSDLLCDWYVETEDTATRELVLVQVVLARARIADLAEILGGAGLTLTRLTVGEAEGRPMPVDLMDGRDPTFRAFLSRLPLRAKAGLALAAVLLLAAPVLVSARQDAALAALAAERAGAMPSGPQSRQIAAVADALESFGRRVPAAFLFDEIAKRLPSNAHLTRFDLKDRQITLATQGGEDDAVRRALAASPFVARVEPMEGVAGSLLLTLAEPAARPAMAADGA